MSSNLESMFQYIRLLHCSRPPCKPSDMLRVHMKFNLAFQTCGRICRFLICMNIMDFEQDSFDISRKCRNVCGFPKIVHGGLTAAIIDESFGFLWLSLRANKQLPFRGPAFTAHLEVDYKQASMTIRLKWSYS